APRGYRAAAAAKTAVHAGALLERKRIVATLAEAIADCAWVVGTTCRGGSYRRRMRTPRAIAPEIVGGGRTKRVALVFGPEDHGLSNDDLKLCHELVTIPTHSSYPSLNLSHAALVCLYELFLARHATRAAAPALAASAALEQMYGDLGRAL